MENFGIIAKVEHRVSNEFENGNVFMIEKNEPIDFVGEVTILAGMKKTSVTIETLTETTVIYFSRKDFEDWISKEQAALLHIESKGSVIISKTRQEFHHYVNY